MKTIISFKLIMTLLLITTIASAQNWYLQNSNTSSQLKGIEMISSTTGWSCGDAGVMLHTTDAGVIWTPVTLTGADLHQVVFKDANTGIVVGDNGVVFTTTNGGTNWVLKNSGTSLQLRGACFAGGSVFYAVGDDGAAVKSTDNGNTWTVLNSGTTERLLCVAAADQNIWIGAKDGLLLFSNNGGTTFTSMSNPATDDIKDIQFIDALTGFACGSNSFFMITTDGGVNWISRSAGIQFGLNGLHFVTQNKGWVTGGTGTIYSTNDAGLNWIAEQTQTAQDLNSIHSFDGENAWAVGNLGVIVTNFSAPTNAENQTDAMPNYPYLIQNYPNPFNPSTKIGFNLPAKNFVTLKVYNVAGVEMATLINENLNEGFHEIEFNAASLNSGVYFYSIITENFASTRKMILIK